MPESKSVKVDNWGVFFLQKLQNFFNKTDYCDLTLQFLDNSQLKVHRLVLSACTDYFNVLEQQCDIADDTLIMPYDLQADVVVPIVNFMYTGTLEFEVNMYARLLKTAKDMNMTVLLKLLEAHKRTVDVQPPVRSAPVLLNKGAQRSTAAASHARPAAASRAAAVAHRKLPASPVRIKNEPVQRAPAQRQIIGYGGRQQDSGRVHQVRGPSRFEANDEQNQDQFDSSFDSMSYESRPLMAASGKGKQTEAGSFEQLRKGYTGVKRPASSMRGGSESPPEKKPNIQDVKEYTEAAKMRNKIAEEFEDDDEESGGELPNETTLIGAKSGDNVDHAKIVSEVLKKYPHLLKNNKNIKLKITQKGQQTITAPIRGALPTGPSSSSTPKTSSSASQSKSAAIDVVPEQPERRTVPAQKKVINVSEPAVPAPPPKKIDSRTMHALIAKGAENTTGPWLCLKCGVNGRPISIPSYKGFRRHLINVHKLKIDPKLCEHCGWKSTKKEELHHHILVIHNLNPPPGMKFPRCTDCNFVAIDDQHLKNHIIEKHPAKASAQHCIYCNKTFMDEERLYEHMRSQHRDRAREDGVMDTDSDDLGDEDEYVPNISNQSAGSANENSKIKVLSNITLPSKGMSPYVLDSNSHSVSSIGGPSTSVAAPLEPSSEAEALSNVASGIATSLGMMDDHEDEHMEEDEANSSQDESNVSAYLEDEMAMVHGEMLKDKPDEVQVKTENVTHFVTEEGTPLELTDEQRADLLQQLQDQQGMVLIMNDDGLSQSENTDEIKEDIVEKKPSVMDTNNSPDETENADKSMEDWESKAAEDDNKADDSVAVEKHIDSLPTTVSAASETKKLIEGDWSDDDEELFNETPKSSKTIEANAGDEDVSPEMTSPVTPEVVAIQKPARSYNRNEGRSSKDSNREAAASIAKDSVKEEAPVANESEAKASTVHAEQEGDVKEEQIKEEETHEEQTEIREEDAQEEATPDIDVPKADEDELKKASKIEIKSLINDWGDDDDDDDE